MFWWRPLDRPCTSLITVFSPIRCTRPADWRYHRKPWQVRIYTDCYALLTTSRLLQRCWPKWLWPHIWLSAVTKPTSASVVRTPPRQQVIISYRLLIAPRLVRETAGRLKCLHTPERNIHMGLDWMCWCGSCVLVFFLSWVGAFPNLPFRVRPSTFFPPLNNIYSSLPRPPANFGMFIMASLSLEVLAIPSATHSERHSHRLQRKKLICLSTLKSSKCCTNSFKSVKSISDN